MYSPFTSCIKEGCGLVHLLTWYYREYCQGSDLLWYVCRTTGWLRLSLALHLKRVHHFDYLYQVVPDAEPPATVVENEPVKVHANLSEEGSAAPVAAAGENEVSSK